MAKQAKKPKKAKQSKAKRAKTRKKAAGPATPATRTGAARSLPTLSWERASVTIRYTSERHLRSQLRQLLDLLEPGAPERAAVETPFEAVRGAPVAAARGGCLSMSAAIDIVVRALSPNGFDPAEELGTTYLAPQEREAFQARVHRGVEDDGCQILPEQIPADEETTHADVVAAIRQGAHA